MRAVFLCQKAAPAIILPETRLIHHEPPLPNERALRARLFRKKVHMKRFLLLTGALAVMMVTISSCASMKRDCQGNKHYRLSNGIYL
jgi:hypothetical protein